MCGSVLFALRVAHGRDSVTLAFRPFRTQSDGFSSNSINNILQLTQQQGIQLSNDPGTWAETVEYGARGGSQPQQIKITYGTTSIHYTTQTGDSFDLQILYSVAG